MWLLHFYVLDAHLYGLPLFDGSNSVLEFITLEFMGIPVTSLHEWYGHL